MTLVAHAALEHDPKLTPPNREFLMCSLDMLSGLAEALRGSIESYVSHSNLVRLLLEVCKEQRPDYTQSAFALWGDLFKYALPHVRPVLDQVVTLLLNGMRPRFPSACNNAVWALGELIVRLEPPMLAPLLPTLLERLVAIFEDPEAHRLSETVALALCRVALHAPQPVAQAIGAKGLVRELLQALRNFEHDDDEKEQALIGLARLVTAAPQLVLNDFHLFIEAIVNFYEPSKALREAVGTLLTQFRRELGDAQWTEKTKSLPNSTKKLLGTLYRIAT